MISYHKTIFAYVNTRKVKNRVNLTSIIMCHFIIRALPKMAKCAFCALNNGESSAAMLHKWKNFSDFWPDRSSNLINFDLSIKIVILLQMYAKQRLPRERALKIVLVADNWVHCSIQMARERDFWKKLVHKKCKWPRFYAR